MKISQKLLLSFFLTINISLLLQASQEPRYDEIANFLTEIERARETLNSPGEQGNQGRAENREQIREFFREELGREALSLEIETVFFHIQRVSELEEIQSSSTSSRSNDSSNIISPIDSDSEPEDNHRENNPRCA